MMPNVPKSALIIVFVFNITAFVQEPVEINCPFNIVSPFFANVFINQSDAFSGFFNTLFVF